MKTPKLLHYISETGNILYVEADQNYSVFHLESGRQLISGYTLKFYEECLDENLFIRINRSLLVSRGFVKRVASSHEISYAILKNGKRIPIPRRRLKAFQEHYQTAI